MTASHDNHATIVYWHRDLPPLVASHVLSDSPFVDIRPPRWGDASGVRGAARLWDATVA